MLVLSRKKGESIVINENISISVIDVQGDQVKLGINAPREVPIYRQEIYEEIMAENVRAAANAANLDQVKGSLQKMKEMKELKDIKDHNNGKSGKEGKGARGAR